MKILSNGFNLYGQLGISEKLLKNFTNIFVGYSVEDLNVNHTYTVLKSRDECEIIYNKDAVEKINYVGKIVKMCSNDEVLLLINSYGIIYKINVDAGRYRSSTNSEINLQVLQHKIANISCGSKITVVYTRNGILFNIPYILNFKNTNIVDIQCGTEHCILLDKFGNVYTFGSGSRGQLGHGQLDDESEPKQVEALGGINITQISAGGWHSFALSKDGDLYTWGWNQNGQLGLGVKEDGETIVSVMASPHVVDFPDPESNVKMVACGYRHTIALLDNNHLFGCGWNKYRQLTNVDTVNFNSMTYLHDLSNETVAALKCGPWNSVVLCK